MVSQTLPQKFQCISGNQPQTQCMCKNQTNWPTKINANLHSQTCLRRLGLHRPCGFFGFRSQGGGLHSRQGGPAVASDLSWSGEHLARATRWLKQCCLREDHGYPTGSLLASNRLAENIQNTIRWYAVHCVCNANIRAQWPHCSERLDQPAALASRRSQALPLRSARPSWTKATEKQP